LFQVGVAIITGSFSFYEDRKSFEIMNAFDILLPQYVVTLRDGAKKTVTAELLVPGDVIEVSSGDIIPADIRILSASGFKVDNAVLTGESRPMAKNEMQTSSNPLETKNMAFCGTYVVEGSGNFSFFVNQINVQFKTVMNSLFAD
jgi:sodium/potassium-transporting ATPase subunit alpha